MNIKKYKGNYYRVYDSKTTERLKNVTSRYNAKISRLTKKGQKNLPTKLSIRDLTSLNTDSPIFISNKRELNRQLRDMEKFLERGSERTIKTKGGLTITKYQYELLETQKRRYRANLYKMKKDMGARYVTRGGHKQDYTIGQVQPLWYRNYESRLEYLRTHKLENIKSMKDLNYYATALSRGQQNYSRDRFWQENFVNDILNANLKVYGYDDEKLKLIKDKLMSLTPHQFKVLMDTDELMQTIYDNYLMTRPSKDGKTIITDESVDDAIDNFEDLYESINEVVESARQTTRQSQSKI